MRPASRCARQSSRSGCSAVRSSAGKVGAVLLERDDEHVDVAHGAELARHVAQPVAELARAVRTEAIAEHAPGRPHPPGGDAHAVKLFRILAEARSGLTGDETREMEPQHLAARLRDDVVRRDARGPPDDEPGGGIGRGAFDSRNALCGALPLPVTSGSTSGVGRTISGRRHTLRAVGPWGAVEDGDRVGCLGRGRSIRSCGTSRRAFLSDTRFGPTRTLEMGRGQRRVEL